MKKIIKMIKDLIEQKKLKEETDNLGKYEIHEDKIIGYVNEEKIKKQSDGPYGYNLIFPVIKSTTKRLLKNLDKPIHYIIENAYFDKRINFLISTSHCHIIFKNCTFKDGIFIDGTNITFDNCKYEASEYSKDNVIPRKSFYIMTIGCSTENIIFIDNLLKITNIDNPIIDMWVSAKNIEFINTNMVNLNSLELKCNNLTLNKSSITSKKTSINAKSIEEQNSAVITVKVLSSEETSNYYEKTSNETIEEPTDEIIYDSETNSSSKKLIKRKEE